MTGTRASAAERVLRASVSIDRGHDTPCVVFGGYVDRGGYGRVKVDGSSRLAHRVAYEAAKGPIPDGLVLDHLCRVRACCNPDHLEVVTSGENSLRGYGGPAKNARKTHCDRGHALTPDNLRKGQRPGVRACAECHRQRGRAAYASRKAAS